MDDANARLSLKLALEEMVDDGYNYDFIVVDCPPDLFSPDRRGLHRSSERLPGCTDPSNITGCT